MRYRSALTLVLIATTGALVALVAWYPGHWLVALLALPLLWGRLRSRLPAYLLWCSYYLAGARDIPVMTEHFFAGYGELSAAAALAMGVAFWLAQAALLAAPWGLLHPDSSAGQLSRASRAILATILVSVPPLGVIGWISPAHLASALFPGWQGQGLALGMVAIAAAAAASRAASTLSVCVILSACAAVAHQRLAIQAVPADWVALSTDLGRYPEGGFDVMYQRTQALQAVADRAFASGAKVVILPEEL
jgi:hypothetical protein